MEPEDSLALVFDNFRTNQRRLDGVLKDTLTTFTNLDSTIRELRTNWNVQDLLLSSEDVEDVEKILKEPEILFCGQTKSGKSSLVNELLGSTVVESQLSPCTARIVQLCYGSKPVVKLIDNEGTVIETIYPKSNRIPKGLANLSNEDRDTDLTTITVVAELNIPFLQSGVKVVDSPGLSENPELNELVESHIESVLPLIVYVIDGRNELSEQHIIDIGCLYRSVPQGNVFFAVTKCDMPEEVVSDDEDEEVAASPESRRESSVHFEEEIRNAVYKKLVDNGFLSPDVPVNECSRYHTLSPIKVKEYRRASQDGLALDDLEDFEHYLQTFLGFKAALCDFVREQLVRSVKRAAETVRASVTKCLDYFVDYSDQICVQKLETRTSIRHIQDQEEALYKRIRRVIERSKQSFVDQVKNVLAKNKGNIMKICAELKFDEYHLPESKFVSVKDIKSYHKQLNNKALEMIGDLIHRQILLSCGILDKLLMGLMNDVSDVQAKIGEEIPLYDSLEGLLISHYTFDISQVKLTKSLWQSVKKFFHNTRDHITHYSGVGTGEVQCSLVKYVIGCIDPEAVADALVRGILAHLDSGHLKFQNQLGQVWELVEKKNQMGEDDRKIIKTRTPDLGRILLKTLDITDRLKFGEIHVEEEKVGAGAQGEIHDCNVSGPDGQPCVVKLIYVKNKAQLGEHGIEIYFTRKLAHPNILCVYGTLLRPLQGGAAELMIIMPKLDGDLHSAFHENAIVHLRDRLVIAQQIAEAIEYMHKLFIVHRDIKLKNILLGPNNRVYLCDFGFTKSIGLTSDSLVGTPIHISPEIILIRKHSTAADVFAFGVLLWYICEGHGNHPNYVGDRTVHINSETLMDVNGLLQDSVIGLRPERLPSFSNECWTLMSRCWEADVNRRPPMSEVVSSLNAIVDSLLRDMVDDLL